MAPREHPQAETYAGEYRDEREAAAEAQGGGGLGEFIRGAIARIRAEHASDEYADGQERRLQEGMETREGPAMPGTYYLGYEHPSLKQMVETNMDPGQVNETGAAWNSMGNALVEFQGAVAAAVGRSGEDWSGAAGDAARSYFSGVGEWMGGTGQAFQLAANRLNAQSESAASAKSGMPEPVNFSMNDAMAMLQNEKNILNLPNTMNQINQKFEEKQRAHERAAEVMTSFAQSMGESGAGMPTFAPVPTMTSAIGADSREPEDSGPIGGRERGTVSWPAGGGGPGETANGPDDDRGSVDSAPPVGDATPDEDPGRTPIQSGEPPITVGPPETDRWQRPTPPPITGSNPPVTFGELPVSSGFPLGGPGGGRGPDAAGGRAAGPGGGRPGIGGERGPSGLAAERAMGRGTSVGRGAGGMSMVPLGAGGRGQGDEDREHQRPSWLEEPDPEAVFGSDEKTSPPVIGED